MQIKKLNKLICMSIKTPCITFENYFEETDSQMSVWSHLDKDWTLISSATYFRSGKLMCKLALLPENIEISESIGPVERSFLGKEL